MEIEDFETVHLAQQLAREKGWEHVMETIRRALRQESTTEEPDDRIGDAGMAHSH